MIVSVCPVTGSFSSVAVSGPAVSLTISPSTPCDGNVTAVFSAVLALSAFAIGASFTSVTVKLAVAVSVRGAAAPLVVPSSRTVYSKLAAPLKSSEGVNSTFVPLIATVPPTALPTRLTVSV